jgi:hypothetical protein
LLQRKFACERRWLWAPRRERPHLILDIDRLEAFLVMQKRHRPAFVIAPADRERAIGTDLLQQARANQLVDDLSGSFPFEFRAY